MLKVDDEREFIVVRDEYKGGEIRLSLRKIEVRSHTTLAASQCAYLQPVRLFLSLALQACKSELVSVGHDCSKQAGKAHMEITVL